MSMKNKLTVGLILLATVVAQAADIANPVEQYMAVCPETREHVGVTWRLTAISKAAGISDVIN